MTSLSRGGEAAVIQYAFTNNVDSNSMGTSSDTPITISGVTPSG